MDVSSAASLKASVLASDGIYFPDPLRSTAGIHFASVLKRLGIDATVASRLRTFPNGATAMRELAASELSHPIGCTQITEINYTDGVRLVGALPDEYALTTAYVAAVEREGRAAGAGPPVRRLAVEPADAIAQSRRRLRLLNAPGAGVPSL